MKNILLVGTGESTLKMWDDLARFSKDPNVEIMCYSNSMELFLQRGIEPDYWFFVDPTSALDTLKLINNVYTQNKKLKTKLLTIHHEKGTHIGDIGTLNKYFAGDTVRLPLEYWTEFWENLQMARPKFSEVRDLKYASIKSINQNPEEFPKLASLGENSRQPSLRFNNEENIIIFGSSGYPPAAEPYLRKIYSQGRAFPYVNKEKYGFMHMTENKMTMVALPVCAHIGFNNVYIVGFDGIGGRWDDPKNSAGVFEDSSFQEFYLKEWVEWKKYTNMNIYSIVEDKYTILNNFIEYVQT